MNTTSAVIVTALVTLLLSYFIVRNCRSLALWFFVRTLGESNLMSICYKLGEYDYKLEQIREAFLFEIIRRKPLYLVLGLFPDANIKEMDKADEIMSGFAKYLIWLCQKGQIPNFTDVEFLFKPYRGSHFKGINSPLKQKLFENILRVVYAKVEKVSLREGLKENTKKMMAWAIQTSIYQITTGESARLVRELIEILEKVELLEESLKTPSKSSL